MNPVEDEEHPYETTDPITDAVDDQSERSARTAVHGVRRVFSKFGIVASGVAIVLGGVAALCHKVLRDAPTGFAFWAAGIGVAVLAAIVIYAIRIASKITNTYLRAIEQASKAADADASEKVEQHLKISRALVDGITSLYRRDIRDNRGADSSHTTGMKLDLDEHNGLLRQAPRTPSTATVFRSPHIPST